MYAGEVCTAWVAAEQGTHHPTHLVAGVAGPEVGGDRLRWAGARGQDPHPAEAAVVGKGPGHASQRLAPEPRVRRGHMPQDMSSCHVDGFPYRSKMGPDCACFILTSVCCHRCGLRTEFMRRAAAEIEEFAKERVGSHPKLKNVTFYISGSDCPGEGEVKLMDWINTFPDPISEVRPTGGPLGGRSLMVLAGMLAEHGGAGGGRRLGAAGAGASGGAGLQCLHP
jgi:hypothetical protein